MDNNENLLAFGWCQGVMYLRRSTTEVMSQLEWFIANHLVYCSRCEKVINPMILVQKRKIRCLKKNRICTKSDHLKVLSYLQWWYSKIYWISKKKKYIHKIYFYFFCNFNKLQKILIFLWTIRVTLFHARKTKNYIFNINFLNVCAYMCRIRNKKEKCKTCMQNLLGYKKLLNFLVRNVAAWFHDSNPLTF